MRNIIALITPAPVSHRTAEENMGIGYLASVLRSNKHEVLVIDGWLEGLDTAGIIKRLSQNIHNLVFVGVSCYRSNIKPAKELVSGLKVLSAELPIIAGGYGPTFYPEEFLAAGFDIVAIGEAEETILKLANYYTGKKAAKLSGIKGIAYVKDNRLIKTKKPELIKNIDNLPFPDRDTLDLAKSRKCAINILSSRGCLGNCAFCSIAAFQRKSTGITWRQRGINNFVDELEHLFNLGVQHFKVIDDSFVEPPRDAAWCKRFADEVQSRKIKILLRGSIRADRVSEEVLLHLRQAGFFSFSCGIENASQTALKRMGKSAKVMDNLAAVGLFKKHNIYLQAGMILFDPETTMVELRENYNFLASYPWIITKGIFTEMYAASGTRFHDKLAQQNRGKAVPNDLSSQIANKTVRLCYNLLKIWHKSICDIYDKAIDPISCPKALQEKEYQEFHKIYTKLNHVNLQFFKEVLDIAEGMTLCKSEQLAFVSKHLERNKAAISKISASLDKLYLKAGISYDANRNPFL